MMRNPLWLLRLETCIQCGEENPHWRKLTCSPDCYAHWKARKYLDQWRQAKIDRAEREIRANRRLIEQETLKLIAARNRQIANRQEREMKKQDLVILDAIMAGRE